MCVGVCDCMTSLLVGVVCTGGEERPVSGIREWCGVGGDQ